MDTTALAATMVVARVLAGLLTGIYIAFLIAVMPALHALNDDTFVTVMNRINGAIVNPAFLAVFFGAPASAVAVLAWQRTPVLIGAAVLGVAALVITMVVNVPLNNALAQHGDRSAFETPWLTWHAIRTTATLGSFVALCHVSGG